MTHDFSVPLDEMPREDLIDGYDVKGWLTDNYATIEFALKLAKRLQEEPSNGVMDVMEDALYAEIGIVTQDDLPVNSLICKAVYSAGIAQLMKEVDDEAITSHPPPAS